MFFLKLISKIRTLYGSPASTRLTNPKVFFYNLSVLIKEEKYCAPNPKLKIEVSGVETLETKV